MYHDIATIQNIIKYDPLPTSTLGILVFGFIAIIKVQLYQILYKIHLYYMIEDAKYLILL